MNFFKPNFKLLAILFSVLFFIGCSKEEKKSLYSEWENVLNNHGCKYTFEENGYCFGYGGGISQENFEKMFIGHGWKNYGTWKIDEEGQRLPNDYYQNLIGPTPAKFYFEKDSVTTYHHVDKGANVISSYKNKYRFNSNFSDKKISVVSFENDDYTQKEIYYFQITGWNLGKQPSFCMVHPLAVTGDNKKIYGVSIYVQMSNKELKELQDMSKSSK